MLSHYRIIRRKNRVGYVLLMLCEYLFPNKETVWETSLIVTSQLKSCFTTAKITFTCTLSVSPTKSSCPLKDYPNLITAWAPPPIYLAYKVPSFSPPFKSCSCGRRSSSYSTIPCHPQSSDDGNHEGGGGDPSTWNKTQGGTIETSECLVRIYSSSSS